MNILAVDTSFGKCSVAVLCDNKIKSSKFENENSKQAESLISLCSEALYECNLNYNDIDYFVATIGPGSFTGIRIGVSALKAMSYASKKSKFLGITTIESQYNKIIDIEEYNYREGFLICLYAGKGEVFTKRYTKSDKELAYSNAPERNIRSISYEEVTNICKKEDIIFCNNEKDAESIKKFANNKIIVVNYDAKDTAKQAYEFLAKQNNLKDTQIIDFQSRSLPIYIRDADAKPSKRKIDFSLDF
jgi:tRNA threonylcarbamoyl adenosine modification protein YeaZ